VDHVIRRLEAGLGRGGPVAAARAGVTSAITARTLGAVGAADRGTSPVAAAVECTLSTIPVERAPSAIRVVGASGTLGGAGVVETGACGAAVVTTRTGVTVVAGTLGGTVVTRTIRTPVVEPGTLVTTGPVVRAIAETAVIAARAIIALEALAAVVAGVAGTGGTPAVALETRTLGAAVVTTGTVVETASSGAIVALEALTAAVERASLRTPFLAVVRSLAASGLGAVPDAAGLVAAGALLRGPALLGLGALGLGTVPAVSGAPAAGATVVAGRRGAAFCRIRSSAALVAASVAGSRAVVTVVEGGLLRAVARLEVGGGSPAAGLLVLGHGVSF
jgi:hypothetical protein